MPLTTSIRESHGLTSMVQSFAQEKVAMVEQEGLAQLAKDVINRAYKQAVEKVDQNVATVQQQAQSLKQELAHNVNHELQLLEQQRSSIHTYHKQIQGAIERYIALGDKSVAQCFNDLVALSSQYDDLLYWMQYTRVDVGALQVSKLDDSRFNPYDLGSVTAQSLSTTTWRSILVFRPSATVSRISLRESHLCHCHGGPLQLADRPRWLTPPPPCDG